MKIKKLVLYIFSLILIISSCIKDKDISKNRIGDSKDYIDLRDHVSSLSIYPLNTGGDFLVGEVDKAIKIDSFFYVLDDRYTKSIFKFKCNGVGINILCNIGNGPDEYSNIRDFDLIPGKDEIAILCQPSKILYTDLALNVKRSVSVDKNYQRMIYNDNYLLLYDHDSNCIDQLDIETNSIERMYSGNILKGYTFHPTAVFYRTDKNLYFFNPGSDMIYRYSDKKFIPAFSLDFQGREQSLDFYSNTDYWNISQEDIINNSLPAIYSIFESENAFGFIYTFNFLVRIYLSDEISNIDGILLNSFINHNRSTSVDSRQLFWSDFTRIQDRLGELDSLSIEWASAINEELKENDCVVLVECNIRKK